MALTKVEQAMMEQIDRILVFEIVPSAVPEHNEDERVAQIEKNDRTRKTDPIVLRAAFAS